jgi:phospholipase C
MNRLAIFASSAILAAAVLAGCASRSPTQNSYMPSYARTVDALRALAANGKGKVSHVIFVVQENRSFNDIFMGYPGAHTVKRGKTSNGGSIKLQAISLKTAYGLDHSANAMFTDCHGTGSLPGTDCRMDAFDKENQFSGPKSGMFAYVPHSESKPYWDMAHEWVLADQTFASQLDESFVAHQYIIAAQAQSSVNVPDGSSWGCFGHGIIVYTITQSRTIGGYQDPCFDYQTLGDELDKAGLPWRFYTSKYTKPLGGFWSAYQAVKHIVHGPDWKHDIITPQDKFLTDIAAGNLASFTWITPTCEESDHTDCGGGYGPSWVTSVVNAVGKSKFWKTSVVFVMWDDWGGLYDDTPPPFMDYDGLGFRVPLVVISPYAKQNYVSHVQYETASVLRFAEDLFDLGQLSAADARAASPAADCFDFKQKPRPFVPIDAPLGPSFFMNRPVDPRIPDSQ